jgi:CrcB protein
MIAEVFSPLVLFGLLIAGGIGSVLRYLLSQLTGFWPWGILLANVIASGFAGWAVIRFETDVTLVAVLVVGLAGGLSTFSAWAAGAAQLVARDRPLAAVLYSVFTLILSSTVAYLGLILG